MRQAIGLQLVAGMLAAFCTPLSLAGMLQTNGAGWFFSADAVVVGGLVFVVYFVMGSLGLSALYGLYRLFDRVTGRR